MHLYNLYLAVFITFSFSFEYKTYLMVGMPNQLKFLYEFYQALVNHCNLKEVLQCAHILNTKIATILA